MKIYKYHYTHRIVFLHRKYFCYGKDTNYKDSFTSIRVDGNIKRTVLTYYKYLYRHRGGWMRSEEHHLEYLETRTFDQGHL